MCVHMYSYLWTCVSMYMYINVHMCRRVPLYIWKQVCKDKCVGICTRTC